MGFSLLSAWQARNKKPPAMREVLICYAIMAVKESYLSARTNKVHDYARQRDLVLMDRFE